MEIRNRGRSQQIWMEEIKKDMLILEVAEEMILNRTEWKKIIHLADTKDWDKDFVVAAVITTFRIDFMMGIRSMLSRPKLVFVLCFGI